MIDYRELLKKYMWHVGECEGTYFLDDEGRGLLGDESEREALKSIIDDLKRESKEA